MRCPLATARSKGVVFPDIVVIHMARHGVTRIGEAQNLANLVRCEPGIAVVIRHNADGVAVEVERGDIAHGDAPVTKDL